MWVCALKSISSSFHSALTTHGSETHGKYFWNKSLGERVTSRIIQWLKCENLIFSPIQPNSMWYHCVLTGCVCYWGRCADMCSGYAWGRLSLRQEVGSWGKWPRGDNAGGHVFSQGLDRMTSDEGRDDWVRLWGEQSIPSDGFPAALPGMPTFWYFCWALSCWIYVTHLSPVAAIAINQNNFKLLWMWYLSVLSLEHLSFLLQTVTANQLLHISPLRSSRHLRFSLRLNSGSPHSCISQQRHH